VSMVLTVSVMHALSSCAPLAIKIQFADLRDAQSRHRPPYYWAPLRVDSFFSRASLLFSTMCPHFSYVGVTIFQYVSLRFSHMSASSPGWTSHNGRPPLAGEPRAWTPSAPEWRRPGVVGSGGVPGEHLWPPAAADPAAAAQFWLAAADQLPERATAAQPSSSAKGQFQGDFQRTMLLSML
jgi:hypothetical protein